MLKISDNSKVRVGQIVICDKLVIGIPQLSENALLGGSMGGRLATIFLQCFETVGWVI